MQNTSAAATPQSLVNWDLAAATAARLSTAGPWTRLDTPGGFVLGRAAVAV